MCAPHLPLPGRGPRGRKKQSVQRGHSAVGVDMFVRCCSRGRAAARVSFFNLIRNAMLAAFCVATFAAADRARAAVIYGVDTQDNLFSFDSAAPNQIISGHFITGLSGGEHIIAIDFRPLTGELYAMSTLNKLYTVDTSTAALSAVGSGFTPQLNGNSFGFDFNPTVDRIRVVSDADQNLRLNPTTGGLAAIDTSPVYAAGDPTAGKNPSVVGAAYSNNVDGATTTTLYDIDSVLDTLVIQNPANAGTLNTVGALGVDVTNLLGFDIGPDGTAYAAMQTTN